MAVRPAELCLLGTAQLRVNRRRTGEHAVLRSRLGQVGSMHAPGARYNIARAGAWPLGPAAKPHDLQGAAYAPA
jgi:hypothetical protein